MLSPVRPSIFLCVCLLFVLIVGIGVSIARSHMVIDTEFVSDDGLEVGRHPKLSRGIIEVSFHRGISEQEIVSIVRSYGLGLHYIHANPSPGQDCELTVSDAKNIKAATTLLLDSTVETLPIVLMRQQHEEIDPASEYYSALEAELGNALLNEGEPILIPKYVRTDEVDGFMSRHPFFSLKNCQQSPQKYFARIQVPNDEEAVWVNRFRELPQVDLSNLILGTP